MTVSGRSPGIFWFAEARWWCSRALDLGIADANRRLDNFSIRRGYNGQ